MKLALTRPLVFFDLETTGVDIANDRIVEISMVKLYPDEHTETYTQRVNPEMHIPEGASNIHHIYDEDVRHCPRFYEIASEVLGFIADCDMAGYNSNHFDVPMLQEELLRANSAHPEVVAQRVDLNEGRRFVDAFVIFQKHTPRNLTAAYAHYCGKELGDAAHGANADTEATREVLMAQLERHGDVPTTIDALADYTTQQRNADLAGKLGYNEKGEVTFNFGKYKGKTLREIFSSREGSGYYGWLMNGDFPMYTKLIIDREWNALRLEALADKFGQTRLF